jgi:hypothetical protein
MAPEALRRRVLATIDAGGDGKRRASRGRARSIGVAIACAVLALGVTLTIVLSRSDQGGSAGLLSSSANSGAPLASLRHIGQGGELEISGLPEPPIGEIYEIWLARPGQPPQPTDALFTVTSIGGAAVAIPGELRGLDAVMVTAEPIGGSSSPTSSPILRVALAD